MTKEQELQDWIAENVEHSDAGRTGVNQLRILVRPLVGYLTLDEMKEAMKKAGYELIDEDGYKRYHAAAVGSFYFKPSEFKRYMLETKYRENPQRDFVSDAITCDDFPNVDDRNVILSYLHGCLACEEAIQGFKYTWRQFQAKKKREAEKCTK